MIRIALIGLGHWGPNYLRLLSGLEDVRLIAVCDRDASRKQLVKKIAADIRFTTDASEVLTANDVDAVIIAAPTAFHYEMGKKALNAGKHVLMEKPLSVKPQESKELMQLAEQKKRILMVGHTFLYNPGITALQELIHRGDLGKIYYFDLIRTNLGPIRQDVNALWDLAPHDISILLHLLGKMPVEVAAHGGCFLNSEREDTVFLTLRFPDQVLAQIHVSWLEPVKVRKVTVIGDKKMAVFNDIDAGEPLRIYDKGVTRTPKNYSDFEEFRLIIREGDVLIPKVPFAEPLKNECQAFIQCIQKNTPPLSDGLFGHAVVTVLDAASQSLQQRGALISINTP